MFPDFLIDFFHAAISSLRQPTTRFSFCGFAFTLISLATG
ncbi:hypothetical protein [Sideroxydans sp. CL21]|nr:hypothetical protein [Sideroxydans sp. CL21]